MSIVRNLSWGACLVSASILLGGCKPARHIEMLSGPTMGSTFTIKYVATPSTPAADAAGVVVQGILDEVDRQMSTYRHDSDISRFNQLPAGSCMPMPSAVLELVDYSGRLSQQTDGRFDITLQPLLNVWGFGPQSRDRHVPAQRDIDMAMQQMGYQYLSREGNQLCKQRDLKLDLNSVAAGYTVDRIASRFEELGIDSYLIEVTGELIAKGKKPDGSAWRIAIEQPTEGIERVAQRILEIDGWGVNTSGDYRNYFQEDGVRFSHTLDARSGRPVTHNLAAVTVIDRSALVADAMGTVLLIMGPDEGMAFARANELAALFVVREGETFRSYASPKFNENFPEGD